MGTSNSVFLEVIEWFDDKGTELAHRIPQKGSGEIKWGAQLIVRNSQAAVFYYQGQAIDAFGAGRHTLTTANIPILTKILSIPWGMTSPLRAEVYFVNMKIFPNIKWGTKDPVAFKDSKLGLVRLRAFGTLDIRIVQPVLFINSLVGTKASFTLKDIEDYLSKIVVSKFNDYLGENLDTLFNLPGKYDEFSADLEILLKKDLSRFGLGLSKLYINAITPPPEVQKAIDDKSRLEVFDNLAKLGQMKAAMAMEAAAKNQGEAGSGLGMGMGFMFPYMFKDLFLNQNNQNQTNNQQKQQLTCPDCNQPIPEDSRFCPYCGHQILVIRQCKNCGKNLSPTAKFCPRCGTPVEEESKEKICPNCGFKNLPDSMFCNQCGEKLK
ncbi:SPFH domain-containing protein [Desulfonauticus submarinus]